MTPILALLYCVATTVPMVIGGIVIGWLICEISINYL